MTHTLHRTSLNDGKYGIDSLDHDFVFLTMSAKTYANEQGSAAKMVKTLEIAKKHNAINLGDMRIGNMFSTDFDDITKGVNDTSICHAVFDNLDTAVAFVKDVKDAQLGISLVITAPFEKSWEVAKKTGLTCHTIEFSGGIWGKVEKLPPPEILDFCTMCGHGMVSRHLVEDCIKRVRGGKMSTRNAAAELAKQCCCGIFNPTRAETMLRAIAGKK